MKLSKFKLSVNYTQLEKSKLKNIVSGSVPDCEVIWVIDERNGVKVPVCVEDYQPGDCLGGGPM